MLKSRKPVVEKRESHSLTIPHHSSEIFGLSDNAKIFLLEKLWNSYEKLDQRRRRTFNLFYGLISLFLILWISHVESINIPMIATKINIQLIFGTLPIIMSFLFNRYLYICRHNLRSFRRFQQVCTILYGEKFKEAGYELKNLWNDIRIRDNSDKFNIFLFPIKEDIDILSLKDLGLLARIVSVNLIMLSSFLFPLVCYYLMVFWFWDNVYKIKESLLIDFCLYIYILLGIINIPYFIHLWFASRHEKSQMNDSSKILSIKA
ncbi:MAG: hypothetical protein DWQ05_20785 [Calditrichaeota bacterium]|nr:MAG: hypothetical protein DWQ05_20785 [Calditrichota bacterium]